MGYANGFGPGIRCRESHMHSLHTLMVNRTYQQMTALAHVPISSIQNIPNLPQTTGPSASWAWLGDNAGRIATDSDAWGFYVDGSGTLHCQKCKRLSYYVLQVVSAAFYIGLARALRDKMMIR